jgi:hypothetical protein
MDLQPAAHQAVRGNICKFYTLTKFHNNLAVRHTTYCFLPRVARESTHNKRCGPLSIKGWRLQDVSRRRIKNFKHFLKL